MARSATRGWRVLSPGEQPGRWIYLAIYKGPFCIYIYIYTSHLLCVQNCGSWWLSLSLLNDSCILAVGSSPEMGNLFFSLGGEESAISTFSWSRVGGASIRYAQTFGGLEFSVVSLEMADILAGALGQLTFFHIAVDSNYCGPFGFCSSRDSTLALVEGKRFNSFSTAAGVAYQFILSCLCLVGMIFLHAWSMEAAWPRIEFVLSLCGASFTRSVR